LASLDAALARCSANHRGDVKRRLRRLQEKGEVTLWVADAGEAELAVSDFREHFGPAYRQIWRQQPGSNLFRQPGFANYAERILGEGLAAGWAHYAVLRVAGTPVAWHLGLFHQEGLYWWMPTYDAAWENLSPGKVLLAKLIEHAISQKWRRLHFLTGGQSYKLAWKPDKPDLRTIRWRAPGLRAALLAGYDAIQRSRGAVA
jgi:CelD/BcsL family acetyltransferase involved in cellulose biosynthesis